MQNHEEFNKHIEDKKAIFIASLSSDDNIVSISSKLYKTSFKRAINLFLTNYSEFKSSFKIADSESENTITESQYNYLHKIKDNLLG